MTIKEVNDIIERLNLIPHPEGGFYKETYRSEGSITNSNLDANFIGNRNYCTGIYFLLTSENFSAFHKINQDEMWHFYKGSPIRIHVISSEGVYFNVVVGNNFENAEIPQFVVKAQDWFAAEVVDKNSFSLVGCTVSPGFDFRDFKMPLREELLQLFPEQHKIITRFTRNMQE